MEKQIPRVLIGAAQGRSGKTTFTLGLLKALRDQGIQTQPFKKGPDYIDPSWMRFASGQECRNLDLFMMGEHYVRQSFLRHSLGKDVSIIEGAMGLFDGLDVEGSNSCAELAYTLDAPVLLVVNCTRLTRSVAAIVNGVVQFDPRIRIGGVILNHVARPRHENILRQSIERYCDVPVLGVLPKSKEIEIPDRHLGLIPAGEQQSLQYRIEFLGQCVKTHVDVEKILAIAGQASIFSEELDTVPEVEIPQQVKIGVLQDRAFSFYYPENLEALEQAGAQLISINSMEDSKLPEVDGLYIGGGFPEVLAEEISANRTLQSHIKEKVEEGLPVYAECGGLMYLTKEIIMQGKHYPMVGIFDCITEMKKRPQGIGYAVQRTLPGNPFFPEGMLLRGHEFHNSCVEFHNSSDKKELQQEMYGFKTERGKGIIKGFDGLLYKNVLAGYHHLHVAVAPEWAKQVVKLAKVYQDEQR